MAKQRKPADEQETSEIDPSKDTNAARVDDPDMGQKKGQSGKQPPAPASKESEGHGTVPNVTMGQEDTADMKDLKEAAHELEEKEGDWSQGH